MFFLTVLDLGKAVKEAVKKQGMLAWQYNTIGVSDAVTMGGEGRSLYLNREPTLPIITRRYEIFLTEPRNNSR